MLKYLLKRIFLIIPTLFGVLALNFAIVQAAPGGPVETVLARLKTGGGGPEGGGDARDSRMGVKNAVSEDMVKKLRVEFGFDKPPLERFALMTKRYLVFDFGKSYFKDKEVTALIAEKLPVSISLGLWTTILIYVVSIPLGVAKAARDGTAFDAVTSVMISLGYALPSFLLAVFLVILFAGGSFWHIFPLRGLTSEGWEALSWWRKGLDYLWHVALPVCAMTLGGFASLAILTKNSFSEEIRKQYVTTARAKGAGEHRTLYGHVFRNAMLVVIAGFPAAFIGVFFTGSVVIENVFSLDGLGLLGLESAVNRDYPVMFATLYIFSLAGLLMNLAGDLMYVMVDPRIHFEAEV